MTKWLLWPLLTLLTGNWILGLILALCGWWVMDRFTLGLLPDPFRFVRRFARMGTLKRTLGHNPSDRRARLELATLLLEQRRYRAALEMLKPNLEAGDDDPHSLFVMGVACLGAGHPEQGEVFLDEAEAREPGFRSGEIHLVRGRWRLSRGKTKEAKEALEALVRIRPGTVEGRVLLARAQDRLGDDVAAAYSRKEAWTQYVGAPRFQRRRDRLWAWRANPSRPLMYLAAVVIAGILVVRWAGPSFQDPSEYQAAGYYDDGE